MVQLKVKSNWDITPLYNVVARIPGAAFPDEWIIRGNHHDAWVNGADDPLSALAALMEEARAYAELLRQGWKPKRTIVYCAWDGEEQALLGSTEWAEEHAEELRRKAVAYINTDSTGRGFLGMSGSHSLEKFINGVARDITDPEEEHPGVEAAAVVAHRRRAAGRAAGTARAAPTCASARSAPAPTTRRSSTTWASRRSTWATAARTAAASTTPSTTISTGTRTSPIPISSTAARWRRPWVRP